MKEERTSISISVVLCTGDVFNNRCKAAKYLLKLLLVLLRKIRNRVPPMDLKSIYIWLEKECFMETRQTYLRTFLLCLGKKRLTCYLYLWWKGLQKLSRGWPLSLICTTLNHGNLMGVKGWSNNLLLSAGCLLDLLNLSPKVLVYCTNKKSNLLTYFMFSGARVSIFLSRDQLRHRSTLARYHSGGAFHLRPF